MATKHKSQKCSEEECSEPRIEGQSKCKEHFAAYMRDYRATVKPMNEREAHQNGVREGITMVVKFLRDIVGGRAVTGYQAAVEVERGMIGAETPEVRQRRALIANMQPKTE